MSKPISSSAALPIANVLLRILIVVNLLGGVAILALLVVMPNREWIMSAFKLSPSPEAERLVMGLRAIAVLGLVATPLNHVVMKRLLAIVETVRRGDPFVAANASRLKAIAWVLLALQILSLVIGAIANAISTPAHPLNHRRRLFDQRMARRTPYVCAGPRVRARRAHAQNVEGQCEIREVSTTCGSEWPRLRDRTEYL